MWKGRSLRDHLVQQSLALAAQQTHLRSFQIDWCLGHSLGSHFNWLKEASLFFKSSQVIVKCSQSQRPTDKFKLLAHLSFSQTLKTRNTVVLKPTISNTVWEKYNTGWNRKSTHLPTSNPTDAPTRMIELLFTEPHYWEMWYKLKHRKGYWALASCSTQLIKEFPNFIDLNLLLSAPIGSRFAPNLSLPFTRNENKQPLPVSLLRSLIYNCVLVQIGPFVH